MYRTYNLTMGGLFLTAQMTSISSLLLKAKHPYWAATMFAGATVTQLGITYRTISRYL